MSFNQAVISVENLRHSYGNTQALKGISFNIEKGRIYGLLGKNGAGKTTAINIIMGFLKPTSGVVRVFGEESSDLSPEIKRKTGLLHEGHLAYDFMTIAQTEHFYKGFYPDWYSKTFKYFTDKLGLPLNRKVKHMSCGQRSQVVLAALMAQGAEVLILDDFSMGLDAGYRRLFIDRLNEFVKEGGKTVLITSHIVQDLERFVDHAVIINKGEIKRSAPLSSIREGIYCYRLPENIDYRLMEIQKEVMDISVNNGSVDIITSVAPQEAQDFFQGKLGAKTEFSLRDVSLEDAFIAITGKY